MLNLAFIIWTSKESVQTTMSFMFQQSVKSVPLKESKLTETRNEDVQMSKTASRMSNVYGNHGYRVPAHSIKYAVVGFS